MTTHSKPLNAVTKLEQLSCGVDDATNVVFMLDELAVAASEGVDSSGNDIRSYTQKS